MDDPREILEKAPKDATPQTLAAYLAGACGDDTALRQKVEALIVEGGGSPRPGHGGKEVVLSATEETVDDGVSSPVEGPGDVIGNYRLRKKLGEGGFGIVYLAEQTAPVKRRVALKIIRLGMDTKQVVARFEAERQALALMEHPNIAKVLDAGSTANGRPFFVMELVRGVPVTDYCDVHSLNTRERLKLFIDVCHAVQHAHQKGIIHRDLKPSNVLVTRHEETAVVKVIDFGVAKATQSELTDKTLFTRFEQLVGTPAYMSPEQTQRSGLDIDTRSDIYALGVLLYELLTGRTPFDAKMLAKAGVDEIRRVIREEDPPRPSTRLNTVDDKVLVELARHRRSEPRRLRAQLRGDLDWIVMKAMEKDRTLRYETANGLAMDVRRHLSNKPVDAGAPGALYTLKKFTRRNKGAVIAGAAVFAALLLGVLGMAVLNEQLEIRERAARRSLYAADMLAVHHALEANNLGLARQLIRDHIPTRRSDDLRGFEWRYSWAASRGDQVQSFGDCDDTINGVAFSPDGRLFAASDYGAVRIWHAGSYTQLSTIVIPGPFSGTDLSDIGFSHDSRLLAFVVDRPLRVQVYDVSDPKEPVLNQEVTWVESFQFSPGGPVMALRAPDGIVLWNYEEELEYENGVHRRMAPEAGFNPCFVGSDGMRLAFIHKSQQSVGLLDLGSGVTESIPLTRRNPRRVAADPTGRFLAVCYYWGRAIELFDVESKELIAGFDDFDSWVWDAVFSSDGDRVAACSADHSVRLFDIPARRQTARFRGHGDEVWSVAFAPGGGTVVTGGKDQRIMVWDARPPEAVVEIPGVAARFHHDGGLAAISMGVQSPAAYLWDIDAGVELWRVEDEIPMGFSKDGEYVTSLVVGDLLHFTAESMPALRRGAFSVETQCLQATLNDRMKTALTRDGDFGELTESTVIAFQRSRGLPVNGEVDAATWRALEPLMDVPVFNQLRFRGLDGRATDRSVTLVDCAAASAVQLRLSPDGRHVVGRFPGGRLGVWDADSGEKLHWIEVPGVPVMVTGERFSLDGRYYSAGVGGRTSAWAWDLATGREVLHLTGRYEGDREGHRHRVANLAFSPDNKVVASASWDGTVGLWDLRSGENLGFLRGHKSAVYRVAFAPGGRTLASAGEDGDVKLWNLATGREVGTLYPGLEQLNFLEFSPDGKHLAVRNRNAPHRILLFNAPTFDEIAESESESAGRGGG